ncbi:adult-specific rigid cuticular protein 15.7-like [Parasteatoda tepidariorum]|uniref:adult-specific rigid cuticular protein 15.7-like n=1 Tax=Parasteatoda tepidariorum TaxID=114398 RepID=UPI00077FC3F0|nr:adult-specific rigid cuticular protein 15.7-like [Parasteatoda tepidariorum]
MISKVSILFAVLAAANASLLLAGHGHLVNTGVSARQQVQDGHGNYAFAYDIKDGKGATNSRSEVGDAHGNKKGSYTLADIDGRARKVEYVADGHGFRAVVKTNEPGTAHSAPAAAVIASPYAAPADIAHAAPVLGHGIAAPLVAATPVAYGHAGLGYGYGAGLGYGAALGHGAGLGYGAALGHGAGLGYGVGLGHGAELGYGTGKSLGYGYAYGGHY